ncbi:CHAT domain-containing protein [Phormidesmis sp. 146-12]
MSQEADRLFQKASQLYEKGTEESLRQAIELWKQALPLYQGNQNEVAVTLNQIGWSYYRIRDLKAAQTYLEQALPLYEGKEARENKARTLGNLGIVCGELGKGDQAIEHYRQAAFLWKEVRNQGDLARVLIYISRIYYGLGDSKLGSYYLAQGEDLLPQVESLDSKANVLLNLGYVLADNNRLEEALPYLREAYSLFLHQKEWLQANATLTIIAEANQKLGRWDTKRVIDYYLNEVLPLAERGNDQAGIATVYQNVGVYYSKSGNLDQGISFLSKAKTIWKNLGGYLDKVAQIYNSIALIYGRQKKLVESLEAINQAITLTEGLRNEIDSRDLRIAYFSTVQDYYETKIHILMEMSQKSSDVFQKLSCRMLAFDVTEQSRSRTLLELLTRSRGELNLEKIEPALRNETSRLQLELKDIEKKLNAATSSEEIAKFERQYIDLSRRLDSLMNGSRYRASEKSIMINDIAPAGLTDAECNLSKGSNSNSKINNIYLGALPDNATLLQYYLGESVSYLFVAGKSVSEESSAFGFQVYTLPGRKEIEAAAEKFYKRLKNNDPPKAIAQTGECLRQKILPRDFLDTYKKERLVISADGVLHNIPFAALPLPSAQEKSSPNAADLDACKEPSSSKRFQNYVPLVTRHEIINVPSVSSIYAIRQRSSKPAPKALAILADPRFDITQRSNRSACPSLRNGSKEGTNRSNSNRDLASDVETALRSVGGVRKQLPCTRIEAEAILSAVSEPSQTLSAFDTNATQQWVMESSLSQYRILHFATHGFASDSQPELSGLVLSRFNRQGQSIEDYFLRLNEIFNLRLSAELVVLSACETGLGKNLRGEGIIGLTRGFMSAGAKRVIASLWNVGDRSTAGLMAKFYHRMLKEGLSPSAALQQTQIEMWRAKRNPNKWAAFAFYGEWEK